jgi:cytochrome P450
MDEPVGFPYDDPAFAADPFPFYEELRESGPVRRAITARGIEAWLVTRYEDGLAALSDPRLSSDLRDASDTRLLDQLPRTERESFLRSMIRVGPPDHTRLRRLVSAAFTARRVAALRPRVQEITDRLLDAVVPAGRADLVADLALPLPVTVISELLGVPPEDQERFRGWSAALARGLDPDFLLPEDEVARRMQARGEFGEYFTELIEQRRAAPREDLLSRLVAVSDQGDVLSRDELLATCVLLLTAGHETTVNLIGNGALALLGDPAQLACFREHPENRAAAVEELLRYDPPVQFTARTALVDTELGGHPVREGEYVLLLTAAANRDPAVFTDPDKLDLLRPAKPHLSFGHGIHFCLGAPLARLEGQIALGKLFEREVALRPQPLHYRDNIILRGLAELPVTIRA